ncbi:HvfC family RiPP maturation protein [Planctobacterium marinum]|uniref:HvfC family RiPP maturation protein n=1 Tax=Planctobacterium marinum TaxID=1631968 RepID=UPI001E313305|nr:putative DNA-binding domain-containing protein [Planctobacterium marinum]MCC2605531.1 putative DNA-binding domain-containing protein [Planctobacterium marinum]
MGFKQTQADFMAHIRDPDNVATLPDIEERRMQIYRDLFFNNILGFLNSGFPVLTAVVHEAQWLAMARHFFKTHDCRSPYFVDISKEFVEYLANELPEQEYPYPFIAELAHYEWLELDLSVRKTEAFIRWQTGDAFSSIRVSPLAELVSYHWPVHQISAKFIPTQLSAEPNYFVVHRDHSDSVHFSQINQVTAFLINQLLEQEVSSLSELQQIMQTVLPHLPVEQVEKATQDIVLEMLQKQIFIPT